MLRIVAATLLPALPTHADSCDPGAACPQCPAASAILDDQKAPGTGSAFQAFDRPNLAADGRVAYTGDTNGPSDADDVIFLDLDLIAMEGAPAPGTPGVFSAFLTFDSAHQVNAAGQVAFIAQLRELPLTQDKALYLDQAMVAQEGMPAPGIPGRTLVDFAFPGAGDDGTVGFLADLDGSTANDSVLYWGDVVLYRQGDQVPGLDGVTWDGDFDEVQWNGAGDLLFEGNTSLPTAMDWVLFLRRHDGKGGIVEEVVFQEGKEVAARAGIDFAALIHQSALAESGLWAMRGSLALAPLEADAFILSGTGFYRQEGEPVAELPGAVLGDFGGLSVNSAGDVLYLADLIGAPAGVEKGLFLNCCLLLTDGAPLPGAPEGTMATDLGFEDLAINDAGAIVFGAGYSGTVSGDGLVVLACGSAPCPADVTGDAQVSVEDLVAVLVAWGTAGTSADVNGDGAVNALDLELVILAWGGC
jgi:hypothetical protein